MTRYRSAPQYSAAHPPSKRRELQRLLPLVRERFPGGAVYLRDDHLLVECAGKMYRVEPGTGKGV